jgi:hypothetical protein
MEMKAMQQMGEIILNAHVHVPDLKGEALEDLGQKISEAIHEVVKTNCEHSAIVAAAALSETEVDVSEMPEEVREHFGIKWPPEGPLPFDTPAALGTPITEDEIREPTDEEIATELFGGSS